MKTLFIGIALIGCFYSTQSLKIKKHTSPIFQTGKWDDSVTYGPQLPGYYSNSVSEYVRRIFQDSRGFLWFGTNTDGLALFDGYKLSYLSTDEGLIGSQITGIMEDKEGKIWFSTNNGISRYDLSAASGKEFQNFGEQEGLNNKSTWCIFQDRKGTIWAGTLNGLSRFNGNQFENFPIPQAEKSWIRSITEDRQGNLWFATADKGAFKFDGKNFRQVAKENGLCSNDLTSILADSKGNLWFGSMDGGLSKYDGETFTNLTAGKEIGNNEVWTIYEDRNGAVWFSSEGSGVYRYLNEKLTQFGEKQGFHIGAVQSIYHDREGRFWFGGGSGLTLFDGIQFKPVTKNGPWGDGC